MLTGSMAMADPACGKWVIVIDDAALVLDGMRGILQGWGCQVEIAASGDAALACLGQTTGPPDLIFPTPSWRPARPASRRSSVCARP